MAYELGEQISRQEWKLQTVVQMSMEIQCMKKASPQINEEKGDNLINTVAF